jgi:Protein of unknown function (DUF2851)
MQSSRLALIQECVAGREAVLQACWAQQAWTRRPLSLADGQPLTVEFPGWLNRGAGPDFRDARLRIGSVEHSGVEYRGDVEIHLDEDDWHRHAHDADPGYGRVILHVVLTAGAGHAQQLVSGAPIPVLIAAPYLSPDALRLMKDPQGLLRRYETLPGRCGLRAAQCAPEALEKIIAHAAESRARHKAQALEAIWPVQDEEQLLFELIFQALGYKPHAERFRALAKQYPLRDLHAALSRPPASDGQSNSREGRSDVLARWFGALGVLSDPVPEGLDKEGAAEYRDLATRWQALGARSAGSAIPRGGTRPWNSPERRMVGLYHHLALLRGDLMKGWLQFLSELDALRDHPDFRQRATEALDAAFATPSDEPWRLRVTYGSRLPQAAHLIGQDRIAVLLANAVVPFFLAYARRHGDAELEKVLYRLFLVLPGEGPNARTRFMTQRLLPLRPLPRTLRTQQGLIQIHQDFCTSFESGCGDCAFPDLIGKAGVRTT